MSEDTRWDLLTRCLHDTAMPIDVRAAGALLLLYGIPVTRIIELRAGQLTKRGERCYLTIDTHQVIVPPAVSRLLGELPASIPGSASVVSGADSVWLFSGRQAGRPVSAASMWRRLRHHGIDIVPARNTTLITLAADLPPAVLSDLLGISITSAVHWARRAARDWTPYLQARLDTSRRPRPVR